MTNSRSPLHPLRSSLPEPMTARAPQSWAYDTVTRRWPEIARRIFAENDLPSSIEPRLEALIADIPHGRIRPIKRY